MLLSLVDEQVSEQVQSGEQSHVQEVVSDN